MTCTCFEQGTQFDTNCPEHGNLRTRLDNKRNALHTSLDNRDYGRCIEVPLTAMVIGPLFAPDSWVLIGDNIPATVQQVCIQEEGRVQYQCIWWNERDRKEVWLSAYEVKPHPDSKQMEVGFHS